MYFSLSAVIALLSSLKFSQCRHNIVVPTLTELGICCLFGVFFISVCVCVFVFRENSIKCKNFAMHVVLGNFWPQESGSSQQEINASKSRKNLRDNVISN